MTTDMTIANTIAEQIGHRAFLMMGTRHKMADGPALSFDIRGCREWKHIKVTLDPMDTYTVSFFKQGPRPEFKVTRLDVEGVYCDMLHATIEKHTGLALSL